MENMISLNLYSLAIDSDDEGHGNHDQDRYGWISHDVPHCVKTAYDMTLGTFTHCVIN